MLVPTQDLAKKYKEIKGLKESNRVKSSRLLEILCKHLNLVQIYIEGRGYIIENHGKDVVKLVNSINVERMEQRVINEKVEQAIGGNYGTILQYLNTKRDRDTLKGILTEITSAKFKTNLANVQDKRSFKRSKTLTSLNLLLFEEMKKNIEETVNDSALTDEAKRRKRHRLLQKMKLEKLRHVFQGRESVKNFQIMLASLNLLSEREIALTEREVV